jgi:hypothetical protein
MDQTISGKKGGKNILWVEIIKQSFQKGRHKAG